MRYFAVMSALNDLGLTSGQLEFLAYLATRQGSFLKKEYSLKFDVADTTINTMVYYLRKKDIIMKDRKLTINPGLMLLDFSAPITLTINLSYETS